MHGKQMMKRVIVLTYMGLLVALQVVLSRFFSINAWNFKIGFSFLPIAVAGMFFGPVGAAVVATVADLVGAILFPSGQFFIGFTVTALLGGLVWGVFLHKKQTNGRILCAVLIEQLILSLLLNTLWISILYSSPFVPLMTSRVVQCLVLGPVQFITVKVMCRFLQRYQKKFS